MNSHWTLRRQIHFRYEWMFQPSAFENALAAPDEATPMPNWFVVRDSFDFR